MTSSPTFSPAAETATPPQTSGPAAPRPSPPGPTSPASPWLHNHAYRRASLSPLRFPSICRCQVDGAVRKPIQCPRSADLGGREKGHEISFLRANSLRIRTGNFLRPCRELNRAIREVSAVIRESRLPPQFGVRPW